MSFFGIPLELFMNFKHFALTPLELYSFPFGEEEILLGCFYRDSVQKTLLKQELSALLSSSKVSEVEAMERILFSLLRFVAISKKKEVALFEDEALRVFLTYEQSLQLLLTPVLSILSSFLTKQQYFAILDKNLLSYLRFLKEESSSIQTSRTLQTFEPLINSNAYEEAKKARQQSFLDEEREEIEILRTASVFSPRMLPKVGKILSESWEVLLLDERQKDFPVFEPNFEMLDIQLTLRSFSSDLGFPVELMKEFWKTYRPEQSLLSFSNLTIQSQSLLRSLHERQTN